MNYELRRGVGELEICMLLRQGALWSVTAAVYLSPPLPPNLFRINKQKKKMVDDGKNSRPSRAGVYHASIGPA